MVNRSNNITNGQSTENKNDFPVYPFSVDIASIPERKYLFGIYKLSKLTFLFILIAIIISLFIIIKAYSRQIKPYFIYWDTYETRFKKLNSTNGIPTQQIRKLSENTYLSEFLIREYLTKTFTTSQRFVDNEENWCDCTTNANLKNTDFLNITKKCYICNFSTNAIYSSFLQNQKPTYEIMVQNGITQTITILDMELIQAQQTVNDTSFFGTISEWISPTTDTQITSEYKVNFILENFQNNKVINQDIITSYITITGMKSSPRTKKIISLSYMFNPNYELILKNYNTQKQTEIKEVQNEIKL